MKDPPSASRRNSAGAGRRERTQTDAITPARYGIARLISAEPFVSVTRTRLDRCASLAGAHATASRTLLRGQIVRQWKSIGVTYSPRANRLVRTHVDRVRGVPL